MPRPSPFHERTSALCSSYRWKDWAGYYAVAAYEHSHEREYVAFRQTAGLIDVSPLYKYEIRGRDAATLLSRMTARNVHKLKKGRVTYTCWCDDHGKVIDDGTISRLDDEHYRLTAAEPSFRWIDRFAKGHSVTVEDSSQRFAVLALQGPTSRRILRQCCDANLDKLRFFRVKKANLEGLEVWVSRTGYTGDLGYEIWVEADRALALWDAIMSAGKAYGIEPAGLDALDMTRIEAGFVMLHVDYYSAPRVVLESRKSTPYELGLGWAVDLDRESFVGQTALQAEVARGSEWQMVGLEIGWQELETLYESYGLPPSLPAHASREPLPIYSRSQQVGRATSHTWSPILKKSIALATVRTDYCKLGTPLHIEHTVEWERKTVRAEVVKTPFFDPERKRKP